MTEKIQKSIQTKLDKLELVYDYSKSFDDLLFDDSLYNIERLFTKRGEPYYIINQSIEVRFFLGKGAAKPRTYIKIYNQNLYSEREFLNSIELCKKITKGKINLISIQSIDLVVDISKSNLLRKIQDIENIVIQDHKGKNINHTLVSNYYNQTLLQTLYINTKEARIRPKERVYLKLYNKSDLLTATNQTKKKSYQNPNSDPDIERLELSITYTSQKNKERFLLDALTNIIMNDPEGFVKSKQSFIIQDIFREYRFLYSIKDRESGHIIFDYSNLFDDQDDLEYREYHIKEYRELWRSYQTEYNELLKPKNKIRRKTKRFSKKIFIDQITTLITIFEEGILTLSSDHYDKIISNAGIRNSGDIESIKTPQNKRHKGQNLYDLFIQKITLYYNQKSNASDYSDPIFSDYSEYSDLF